MSKPERVTATLIAPQSGFKVGGRKNIIVFENPDPAANRIARAAEVLSFVIRAVIYPRTVSKTFLKKL